MVECNDLLTSCTLACP